MGLRVQGLAVSARAFRVELSTPRAPPNSTLGPNPYLVSDPRTLVCEVVVVGLTFTLCMAGVLPLPLG